jgi:hypothetical protein
MIIIILQIYLCIFNWWIKFFIELWCLSFLFCFKFFYLHLSLCDLDDILNVFILDFISFILNFSINHPINLFNFHKLHKHIVFILWIFIFKVFLFFMVIVLILMMITLQIFETLSMMMTMHCSITFNIYHLFFSNSDLLAF